MYIFLLLLIIVYICMYVSMFICMYICMNLPSCYYIFSEIWRIHCMVLNLYSSCLHMYYNMYIYIYSVIFKMAHFVFIIYINLLYIFFTTNNCYHIHKIYIKIHIYKCNIQKSYYIILKQFLRQYYKNMYIYKVYIHLIHIYIY